MTPRRVAALLLLLAAACASSKPGTTSQSTVPGHGALSVTVTPNPIVARPAGGNLYEFAFDVIVRETGGHAVTINSVTVDVYAFSGRVRVASESYDAARLASQGYPTTIPANGERRYHFAPRREVADERLFGGVTGEVRIDGTDDGGAATTARISVGVTK